MRIYDVIHLRRGTPFPLHHVDAIDSLSPISVRQAHMLLAVCFDSFWMHRTFRAFALPEDTPRADFTDPQNRLYGACPQRSREVAGYGFGEVGACVVE